jgi:sugar lactone lactonase YvrE
MATSSFTALRRIAGYAFTLTLFSLCLTGVSAGQGSPLVTATSAVGLSHPSGWGAIQQTAIDKAGDWLVVDYAHGALYEFPAGGGPAITLGAATPTASLGGGYQNPGIAIDPGNNLYLEANWNNCLVMFPWNATTGTWTGLNDGSANALSPSNPTTTMCTNSGTGNEPQAWAQYGIGTSDPATGWPYWYQPWAIAIGNSNNLIVGTQTNGQFIFSLSVNNAWTNPTAGQVTYEPITGVTSRSISVAQDPEGNIYFVEDYSASKYLPGVLMIPNTVTNATQLQTDVGLTRVDPNLPAVRGVITDAAGNLYISDAQVGVVEVPNPSGTPQTNSAVVVSGVPAQGEVAIDWARNLMYVPTTQTQTNNAADVAKVGFSSADLGSSTVGTTASTGANVVFSFNGSATPANFTIVEDGVQKPDFAITGGTCVTGTAYAAQKTCLETVSFTPNSVGSISANLLMLDASNNVLASMVLHGIGTGANIQATPALESAIDSGLMTPSQVAVDAAGSVYVADAGLGKVLKLAAGSGTPASIGTGLTAPTGVAVDGSGDVFIADSGKVYEVPFGPSGLNAAGQVTLVSGLGSGLQLAADSVGNLYVADPANARVVVVSHIGAFTASNLGQTVTSLTTGFTAPSFVAVDADNNLYVIDGANLFKLAAGAGTPTALLNNLSGSTGLAVDPSGAVYITAAGGTTRIPSIGGVLAPANESAVAASVTSPMGVTLDRWGNIYVVDGTGLNIHTVGVNGAVTLPTPASLTSSTGATATIVNAGNAPLSISGYVNTNPLNPGLPSYAQLPVDFTGADGTCVSGSPVPVGGTCQVAITFNPGAGEDGTLNGIIGITSSAVNSPIVINATGVGLSLAASVSAAAVDKSAEVVATPLTVTVAPKTGSGTPTGTVTVIYPSWTVVTPKSGPNAGIAQINPVNLTATATLDGTGKAKFALAPVLAGTDGFTVNYSGDRVYGKSTITVNSTVARSAIKGITLPTLPDATDIDLPFVVAGTGSGTAPYDPTSEAPWQYKFQMTVNTAFGVPTGTITVMDNATTCPPGTSASGIGTATCILAGYSAPGGYSGVACPNLAGQGVLPIANDGTAATGAGAQFATSCLWYVPQGVNYSPVIFTHYITPVYSGDANFLGLTGPTPTLLQSVRGPVVQITQTGNAASLTAAPSLTVSAGSTASMNLTITSRLGYGEAGNGSQLNNSQFPVSLSCDNLPPHTQCSFTYPNPDPTVPNSVDILCPSGATAVQLASGAASCTPGKATVTFYTDVSAGTTTSQNARTTSITLAAIFGFGMMGLFFRRRAFAKQGLLLMVFLMIVGGALAVSITACNTTTLTPQSSLATPAGTYQATITAQEVGTICISTPGAGGANCIVPGSSSTTFNGTLVYGSGNQVSLPFYVSLKVQ